MTTGYLLVMGSGVLALLFGIYLVRSVLRASPGNEKMQEIAAAIQEGASAYLNRQYQVITGVGIVILAILVWVSSLNVCLNRFCCGFLSSSVIL